MPPALTLERILTSPRCFGLVTATPIQRVLCRAFDGLPFDDLLEAHPELAERIDGITLLERTFGPGGLERLPNEKPREIYLITGIRTGKSLLLAAIAFQCAMTADLASLQPWEEATVPILSLTLKKARIILRHLKGPLLSRPHLRALLPREPTGSCLWVRRPHDGRIVRVEIAAGARAGGALVGDWVCGVLFDEFPRMTGEEDGSIINFDESRNAVVARIREGGMLAAVGSPHAPRGPAYEVVKKHFGNPSRALIVARPPARAMHPDYWTDAKIEELLRSPKGRHIYQTDYLGEFADPESNFFSTAELEAVTRKREVNEEGELDPLELPYKNDCQHFAAMDPAMMRNAWTFVIARREYREDGSSKVVVVFAKQWVPGRIGPLNPEVVIAEIKAICVKYHLWEVFTDRWKSDELQSIGEKAGLTFTVYGLAGQDNVNLFDSLKLRVLTGGLELPDDPEIRTDLLAVRRVVRNRSIGMDFPFTNDGRHCDYAPSIAVVNQLAAQSSSWTDAMGKLADRGGRLF